MDHFDETPTPVPEAIPVKVPMLGELLRMYDLIRSSKKIHRAHLYKKNIDSDWLYASDILKATGKVKSKNGNWIWTGPAIDPTDPVDEIEIAYERVMDAWDDSQDRMPLRSDPKAEELVWINGRAPGFQRKLFWARDRLDYYYVLPPILNPLGQSTGGWVICKNKEFWLGPFPDLPTAKMVAQREALESMYPSNNFGNLVSTGLKSWYNTVLSLKKPGLLEKIMPTKTKPAPRGGKKNKSKKGKSKAKPRAAQRDAKPEPVNGFVQRYLPAESKPTMEEVQGAITGLLKPREEKGNKKQDELGMKDELGRPAGRPLGVSTGLPVGMAVCYALIQNEKASKGNKFTDEDIANWLRKEFPGRPSKVFDNIGFLRYRYNNGYYMRGAYPQVRSRQYDAKGAVIPSRGRGSETVEVVAE